MKELDWFVQMLVDEFRVIVDRNQISFEGNELYLDEIDESLIPNEMTKGLPEKLQYACCFLVIFLKIHNWRKSFFKLLLNNLKKVPI